MSKEYTETTTGLVAPLNGIIRLDYVATAYGTISIDELIGGVYVANADFTFTTETHKIITLVPQDLYRLTITGGTAPIVKITELARHTA